MGMQETATRVLECLGLYIGRYPMPHTLEHHLRYLLWALDIECVLDVGANVGQYGLRLRALGYQGRIVSFEPYPRAHGLLQERVANDPKWSVVPYALGDRSGARALIAYADSSLNSFHEPSGEEPGRFPDSSSLKESRSKFIVWMRCSIRSYRVSPTPSSRWTRRALI